MAALFLVRDLTSVGLRTKCLILPEAEFFLIARFEQHTRRYTSWKGFTFLSDAVTCSMEPMFLALLTCFFVLF